MNCSNRNLGSRLQYQFFHWIVRFRAVPIARALLALVVLYYTMLPHVRRRCFFYLQRRFGATSRWRGFTHAYRLYWNFGQILLDRMITGTGAHCPVSSTTPAVRAQLLDAARNPKGCILLTAHMGAWQRGLMELRHMTQAVHIVQPHDPDTPDAQYFERSRERTWHIIDAADWIGACVQITAALRRGELVCLMGDRLSRDAERSVPIPFLGGTIALPVSAYALASITEAELVVQFTVREKGVTRALHVERFKVPPHLPRHDPAVFAPYAARFALAMEEFVRIYPYQFFNFYNMWLDDYDKTGN